MYFLYKNFHWKLCHNGFCDDNAKRDVKRGEKKKTASSPSLLYKINRCNDLTIHQYNNIVYTLHRIIHKSRVLKIS